MKRFISLASLLISLTISSSVNSQIPSFSNEVNRLLESTFDQEEPGIALVITKRGETIYSGAFGSANLELQIPLTEDMPFEVASITKQITSAAILMLEHQNKLSVSDTLSKYFPDHPSSNATLEQLMQNVSGIFVPDHSMGSNHVREDISQEERYELIVSGEPYFEPGERYAYSNSGYWLLGDIIEYVSGLSYGEFVRRNIFEPLGMSNSYYGSHREIISNRVSGYDYTDEGLVNASYTSESWSYSAGGLVSSAVDIAKWNNALFSGALIPISSVEKMITPATLNNGEPIPYGFGFALGELDGNKTAGHGGGHSGFLVHSERLIDQDVFVVVLANSFYFTNGYQPPDSKNPALIARRLAQLAANE